MYRFVRYVTVLLIHCNGGNCTKVNFQRYLSLHVDTSPYQTAVLLVNVCSAD